MEGEGHKWKGRNIGREGKVEGREKSERVKDGESSKSYNMGRGKRDG